MQHQFKIFNLDLLTSMGHPNVRLVRAAIVALGVFVSPIAVAGERSFDLTDFDGVSVGQGIHVLVAAGEQYKIVAETKDTKQLELLELDVRRGILRVKLDTGLFSSLRAEESRVTVRVTMPKLIRAEASSGASMTAETMSGDDLELNSSGGAVLQVDAVDGKTINVTVSGGAEISVANGSCMSLSTDLSGGSSLDMKMVKCIEVEVDANGGSRASVHAEKMIDADASSGASVAIFGKPQGTNIETSSGGSIDFQ